jgi:signal transduction histidine kinase
MTVKPRIYDRLDVKFMLIIGVFLAILLASIFWYMSDQTQESIISELHTEAKIVFDQVVITRHWNAGYGGVYVEKINGVESNPYLRKLGVEPDIQSVDGRNFTLKNPALMTRELSLLSKEGKLFEFHITSLDLVNPSNAPDEFERKALGSYNRGETEATQIVERNGSLSYQYMAPLYVTKDCQKCHTGYNIGEVRGGVSVFLPMNNAYNAIQTTKRNLLAVGIGLIAGVEILLFFIVNSLVFRPIGELKKGAQNLGFGDLAYRIPVKSRDEIGLLGTVFNKMASDLFENIREVENSKEKLVIARDEAVAANAFKTELLMKMSHELRTPLNAILGFSDLLSMKQAGELNERQEQYIAIISKSGRHLLGIINDIIDLAKVESGEKLPLSIEQFLASDAIDETLVFVSEKAIQKNIIIKREIDPEIGSISADKIRFKQILLNLLDNAIKFSKPQGGTILIAARKAGNMAQFSVYDTGIGIREEEIGKLFSLFYQADSGISRKYGGAGVGLAIIKQLVEQQGGRIWVDSKFGEGSTFTFTIPISC